MKQFKQFTTTALTLSLCFALTACSSESNETATPDQSNSTQSSTTDNTNNGNSTGNADNQTSAEVTYESYLLELTTFTENFMSLQEPFIAAATAFSTNYTNPEVVTEYVENLNHMIAKFGEINKITPTDDLAEVHQNFVNSCHSVTAVMNDMIAILEDDFANAGHETLDAYNALFTGDYQTSYSEFATNIFALADEIQAKMG